MNKCVICGKECEGKCCSAACRAKKSRRTRTVAHATVDEPSVAEFDKVAELYNKPLNFGQPDCKCMTCRANKVNGNKHKVNHGPYKHAGQLARGEVNRVALPGDVDYTGVCELVNGKWVDAEADKSNPAANGKQEEAALVAGG